MLTAILAWAGWPYMFLALTVALFCFAVFPLEDQRGKTHVSGVEIMFAEWVITYMTADMITGGSVVIFYSVVDVLAALVFLSIARTPKAIWAASCVIFHLGMSLAHVLYFVGFVETRWSYVLALNVMFALCLVSIFTGIWAARYDRKRMLDRLVDRFARSWTISGFRLPRYCLANSKV